MSSPPAYQLDKLGVTGSSQYRPPLVLIDTTYRAKRSLLQGQFGVRAHFPVVVKLCCSCLILGREGERRFIYPIGV